MLKNAYKSLSILALCAYSITTVSAETATLSIDTINNTTKISTEKAKQISATDGDLTETIVYQFDFSKQTDGTADKWFIKEKFEENRDGEDIIKTFKQGKLYLEAKEELIGFWSKKLSIKNANKIRITWGADKFPKISNWEQDIRRSGLSIAISFGDKEHPSGSWVVPNVPYFISLFIDNSALENKPYIGGYWQNSARYVCIACNVNTGERIISEFNLTQKFKEYFQQDTVPYISSITFDVDTRDTDGISSVFVEKIEFIQ